MHSENQSLNSLSNIKQQKQSRKHSNTRLHDVLQGCIYVSRIWEQTHILDFDFFFFCIKDLALQPNTITFLEQNIGKALHDLGICKNLWRKIPKAQAIKVKINKWGYILLRYFFCAKETVHKVKRQPTEWEKILANYAADRKSISRV